METIELEAELELVGEKYYIRVGADPVISIPISDDDANAVKSAFCQLIQLLRSGPHQISLAEAREDLFYLVAKEYLDQLNGELMVVYEEMEQQGFINGQDEEN